MRPFDYARAGSAAEAVKLAGDGAAFIAGGTNLLDLMKLEVMAPGRLVDINHIDLADIEETDEGGLRIGAMVRNSDLAADARVRASYPVLSKALLAGASGQLRNKATTGGNLLQRTRCYYFYDTAMSCNKREPGSGCSAIGGVNRINAIFGGSEHCIAAYPGDMAVALLALDAELVVQGETGERRMRLADFYRQPGDTPQLETTLEPGELITAILLPPNNAAEHSHYLKLRDRATFEWALVSVAVALEMHEQRIERARIVAGGVGTTPWRLSRVEEMLQGATLTADLARQAGDSAGTGAAPKAGNAFKVPMLQRAVERAVLNAGGLA